MNRLVQKILVLVFAVVIAIPNLARSEESTNLPEAPNFTLKDQNGVEHNLRSLQGKVVVLEWVNPDCPYVKRHHKAGTMQNLVNKYAAQGVVWFGVNSTHYMDSAKNQEFVEEYKLSYPILSDQTGTVGKAYTAKTTPFMVVIDKNGKIAYKGAIDNDPHGDESQGLQNYVDLALAELSAGQQIKIAQTSSYGCSVKYAS